MLDWIDIKDFAIAKHIELDFAAGLSVITGETGAGKSIFINALSAALGNRVDKAMVRHGQQNASIQASFTLPPQHKAHAWLEHNALQQEGQCLLRRVISSAKTSKAFINGNAVSAATLKELGSLLMDIHGQHEHQSLLKPQTQQELLDLYGNCDAAAKALSQVYQSLSQAQNQLQAISSQEQDLRDRLELVSFQLAELETFAPGAGEWAELELEHKRLHNAAAISLAVQNASTTLSGEAPDHLNTIAQLASAKQQLSSVVDYAPELKEAISTLIEAETLLSESALRLDQFLNQAQLDDQALARVESRYSEYHSLARKYQREPEQLHAHFMQLQETQRSLHQPEKQREALLAQIEQHTASYHTLAKKLSAQRAKAAKQLSDGVTEAMQTLGLKGGRFMVELKRVDTGPSAQGEETIAFDVITNPGFPAQALAKVASGGELSRISLAIQALLAENKTSTSMVFDEVDVGVGGQTAAIVGKLLDRLARHSQILCITHLPQVAAHATAHYVVVKNSGDETHAQIRALDQEQRVEEIARMAGGEHVTDASLAHARSLLGLS